MAIDITCDHCSKYLDPSETTTLHEKCSDEKLKEAFDDGYSEGKEAGREEMKEELS